MKDKVRFCAICGNVSERDELCRICRDARRDPTVLCVVEEPKDVVAIEKTREFRGRYHVLGGAISPIDGIGPEDLRTRELMVRLSDGAVTEVILACDPNLEGEATATYLVRLLSPLGLRVSMLASGLPVGGDLEYADEVTLGRAFDLAAVAADLIHGLQHYEAGLLPGRQVVVAVLLRQPLGDARQRGAAGPARVLAHAMLDVAEENSLA